jgi:hypothetical protein
MVRVNKFGTHFIQRWAERMGGFPSIEEVNEVLAGSLRIIKQRILWKVLCSGGYGRHEVLSHFWNHERGIIVLVDEYKGTAVTLLTPGMIDKYSRGAAEIAEKGRG